MTVSVVVYSKNMFVVSGWSPPIFLDKYGAVDVVTKLLVKIVVCLFTKCMQLCCFPRRSMSKEL